MIDEVDRQILAILQQDARTANAEIARRVGLAPSAIFERMRKLQENGIVERFSALPGVSLTPAGKSGRVYRVDESEIMYFGPRTPRSVERMAGWLRGAAAAPNGAGGQQAAASPRPR